MATVSPEYVVQGLIQRGIPPHIALGFAGNAAVESAFNPTILGDGGNAHGLFQWNDRADALKAFAAQSGRDWRDPDAQLDFVVHELQGSESGAWGRIQTAQTPEEAAQLISAHYERPGTPHLDRRIAATRDIAAGFGDYGSASAGDFPADPSIAGGFGAQAGGQGGAFPGYGSAYGAAWGDFPMHPGLGFGPSTLPMEDWGGSGNALADLTPFGAGAGIRAPGQIEATPQGNALASLGQGQEPGYGASGGYAMGGQGAGAPQAVPASGYALRPGVDASIQQLLAAFMPRPTY